MLKTILLQKLKPAACGIPHRLGFLFSGRRYGDPAPISPHSPNTDELPYIPFTLPLTPNQTSKKIAAWANPNKILAILSADWYKINQFTF
jgi:hypothetical protein